MPPAPSKDWYVLWRPPRRIEPTQRTGVAWMDAEAQASAPSGEWEVYQQGLTQRAAERLARRVSDVMSPRWFGKNVSTKVGRGDPPKLNPPWTTKALAKQWDDLSSQVGASWMPSLSKAHAGRKGELVAQLDTLGCGAYGCVLETGDPEVVLKVTSDASEAEFAMKVLPRMGETAQRGFVRYEAEADLDSKHERRPLVALWRQAASDVGKLGSAKGVIDRYLGRNRKAMLDLIHHQWDAAQVGLDTILHAGDDANQVYRDALEAERWSYDPHADSEVIAEEIDRVKDEGKRFAAALSYFQSTNEAMKGTPLARVGAALNALLAEGVFVADVHEGNLGRVRDDETGDQVWVITDPGNAVILPGAWR